jgi:hypothetical protein
MKQFIFFILLLSGRPINASTDIPHVLMGRNIVKQTEQSISILSSEKKTVVLFLSAKCPCSNSHIPLLKDLAKNYTQFQFVGLHSNANEGDQVASDYFQKAQLPFPILQDQHTRLANLFKAYKTPHAFIISQQGDILYKGGITDSSKVDNAKTFFLQNALEDLKHGRDIKVKEGRTLGCMIMRENK